MKKLILILAAVAAILPAAAFADHRDGFYQGYGSNFLSFSFGNNQHARYGHGSNVQFVDHRGAPYNHRKLQPGHPIRVQYSGRRGHEQVQRVIVQPRRGGDHGGNRGRGNH
jgi:hypothetical protein